MHGYFEQIRYSMDFNVEISVSWKICQQHYASYA